MARTIVGIDISASGLRAVELVASAKMRPALLRHYSIALPAGAVSRGEVIEKATVSTALKQLWSRGKFSSKDAVLGIGNARVFARNLSVPTMSLELIRESLPFQVQDMIPFPAEDAVLDFYPISESNGDSGPVVNGVLVAAVRDAVLGNVNAAQLAGINVLDVDLIPFALARTFLRGSLSAGTSAVVDLGANTTTVVVSTDGVPQFLRIIPTGGSDLTTALSNKLGVDIAQAELMKCSVGVAPNRQEDRAIGSATTELTAELMNSLRTTLAFFANSNQASPIGRIVLTGGGAGLPGFATALAEFTRMPVTIGDPLEAVTVTGGAQRSSLANGTGTPFAVAIGLALWGAA
ncbi:MAG: type IV pilus assembly protein PilM [Rhodoglobus sp.]